MPRGEGLATKKEIKKKRVTGLGAESPPGGERGDLDARLVGVPTSSAHLLSVCRNRPSYYSSQSSPLGLE